MTFDSLTLVAVAAELRRAAAGQACGSVVVTSPEEVVVGLGSAAWLISIAAGEARTHLVPELPPAPGAAPGIQTHLDSLIRGGRVTSIEAMAFDRVLHVEVDTCDRVGRPRPLRLIVELMGKHSAFVVVGEDGLILATLKPVTRAVNRHREILPKLPYVPPPSGGRSDPRGLDEAGFAAAWPELASAPSLRDGWRRRWFGLSDELWSWLCARAGLPEDASGDRPATREALWQAWAELQAILAAEAWQPCVRRDRGLPVAAWPLALPGCEPVSSVSAGLHLVASRAAERAATQALRSSLGGALSQALRRTRARLADVAKRQQHAGEADHLQAEADLILSNLHLIAPRQTELVVPDWPTPGETARLRLDPAHPATQQAERLYDRARRARQAAASLPADEARLRTELAELERLAGTVAEAPDAAALARGQDAVHAATGGGPAAPVARPHSERERLLQRIPRYQTADGWVILVGRNAAESEGLLSKLAAPTDLWLHVRGAGSGHVILRTEGRPEAVPPAAIEEAARIAAWHSRMKHSALVPVACTQRKYVTKVRGGAAGKVVYRNERTIFVEPARP